MQRLVMAALVGTMLVPGVVSSAEAAGDKQRVFGATRYETAVEISRLSFPESADVVYLARGDVLADALAAGTLTDGPVLLVPSCGEVTPEVKERIEQLDPSRVLALGGPGAICDQILSHVAGGRQTGRVAGGSRYETAVEISKRAFPDGADVVYVANGNDSPDAVAGGALTDGPILLVPPGDEGQIPTSVLAEVHRLGPQRVYALGGTVAVSNARLKDAAGGISASRVAGKTRYDTAARIAERQFPTGVPMVTAYLARGDVFADAVAAGSLTDGPVLLVPSCGDVPQEVVDYLREAQPSRVVALGGQGAVCDRTLEAAAQFTGSVEFIRLVVDGPELRLDATKAYVLVSDVPAGQVSLVFHDFSRNYAGQTTVETYDTHNDRVLRGRLRDSDATHTVIADAPGQYITRLTPEDVEPGAQIRAVATKWKDPGLSVDAGNVVHVPDRFGSGLAIPLSVTDSKPLEWMSGTVVDNVVDVYGGRATLQTRFPDGSRTQTESFSTNQTVSVRWPVHAPGDYEFYVDPQENRIATTVSTDTWLAGSTSLSSPPFGFQPQRIGDGGTWAYSAGLRQWHSIVAFGPCVSTSRFELSLLDRTNTEMEEARCNGDGVAAIDVEPLYAGTYGALVHSLATDVIEVAVTPWAVKTHTIGQPSATHVAGDVRGRGGVIHFEGQAAREVTITVQYPDAERRPTIKLERPSGVFLEPPQRPAQTADSWTADFRLVESGQYSVLVDTLGYRTDFSVTVS